MDGVDTPMLTSRVSILNNSIHTLRQRSTSEGASFAMPWLKEQEIPCRDSEQMANKGLTQKLLLALLLA